MKPLISIIVPVYNTEKYLQDCIDSLVNQTMKEIEIIFVNDASTDSCLEIMKKNQKECPDKIIVIDSKENLKQGGARNLGLRIAQGDYILFVDSDDFVAPTICEKMYKRIIEQNADICNIALASTPESTLYNTLYIGTESSKPASSTLEELSIVPLFSFIERQARQKWNSVSLNETNIENFLVDNIPGVIGNLWRKSLIMDNAIWFPEHLKFEDVFFTTIAAVYIKKYSYIEETEYFYRIVPTSTIHARNQQYSWDKIEIMKLILNEAKQRDLFSKYYSVWEYKNTIKCFEVYFRFMHRFDKPPKDLVKKIMSKQLKIFPKWKHNLYYKRMIARPRRFKYALISKMPIVMLYIHPQLEKITKFIEKMKTDNNIN